MKPNKLRALPPSDLNIIILPFTKKDDKQRQRISKFHTKFKQVLNLNKSMESFVSKTIILIENSYNKVHKTHIKSIFQRMQTKEYV